MPSIVMELQQGAISRVTPVSELLRMAKVIAVKLQLPDLATWVEHELDGYEGSTVPAYRMLSGQLKGRNPYHGWIPVLIGDRKLERSLTRRSNSQPIGEIEDLCSRASGNNGDMRFILSGKEIQLISRMTGTTAEYAVFFSSSSLSAILDAVRKALLEWSLKLEAAGIVGEGLSFSPEEKQKAHGDTTITIGKVENLIGNLGPNSGTVNASWQQPSAEAVASLVSSIRSAQEQLGLSSQQSAELDRSLQGLSSEFSKEAPAPGKVRGYVASIRNIAEGAVGSLAASGILYELAKHFPA